MNRILSFCRWSRDEKLWFCRAFVVLVIVQIGLKAMSLQRVLRLTNGVRQPEGKLITSSDPTKVCWAVKAASRYLGNAKCLPQAITTQILLARAGISTCLRIGFAKNNNGVLEGHAWLEADDEVVFGGVESPHFIPFTSLDVGFIK